MTSPTPHRLVAAAACLALLGPSRCPGAAVDAPPASAAEYLGAPSWTGEGGVAGGSVTLRVHGRFVFHRTVEASPATVGGARMRVDIWDQDAVSDELMWTTETDDQGFFDAVFEWDDCDVTGCDDPDLYIVVRALNDDLDVERDTILQTTWAWSTVDEVLDDVTASDIDLGSIQPADPAEHGAVHVHTVLALSRQALAPVGFPILFPLLEVDWAPDAETTELDGTRLSVSAADGWSEVVLAREHLLFVLEQKTGVPLASLCNGICDDDGCSYCLWCMETPEAAWRVGAATWYGDALSRSLTGTTGAPPLTTVPAIEATFPCPDGLPSDIRWVPGVVAALLRDIEDVGEVLDVDGDGIDDAPPETGCERDSLFRGLAETVERVVVGEHTTVDGFVEALWASSLPKADLWRTLRRVGGDVWTGPDSGPPAILLATSSTHPGGVGPSPFATLVVFGGDAASGISGASVMWSSSPHESVDESVDVAALPQSVVVVESPAIPYAGVLYLHIRLVDCAGNWSDQASFGPLSVSDCDADGVPDVCACGGCAGLPGYCPPEVCGTVADCNGNLIPDACEIDEGAVDDCNDDGVPDACQGETDAFLPPFGTSEANWHVAGDWSLGSEPTAAQIACLDLGDPGFVTRLPAPPANVLAFGCDHILDVQTTLTATAASHAHRVDLNGGTLAGAGDVTVGDLRWTSGSVTKPNGTSPALIASSLTTLGGAPKSLLRDTLVVQALTHGSGQLALGQGAGLEIGPLAIATIASGASITWSAGSEPSILNHGVLRKIGPGTSPVTWVGVTNAGTLDVAEGRLELAGGASSGEVVIDDGATLALQSGTFAFEPGSTLVGDRLEVNGGTAVFGEDAAVGTLLVGAGAPTLSMTAGAVLSAESATILGGTIDGAGDLDAGSLAWTGGTMSGAGTTTAGSLTIGGASQKNLRRPLVAFGQSTSVAGSVGLSQGGELVVARGGSLTLLDNAGFTWISGGQPGSLVNHGTVVRSGPGLSNLSLVTLNNHGVIDVADGVLRLDGTGSHTGTVTGAGTMHIIGGAQSFAPSSSLAVGHLTITGGAVTSSGGFAPTSLVLSGGTLTLDSAGLPFTETMTFGGGTLAGTAPLNVGGALAWTGGTMTGSAAVNVLGPATLSGGGAKSLRRPLVADGSMAVTAPSVGIDAGGELVVPADAELALAGGTTLTWISGSAPGTLDIAGTLRKTADAGTASILFAPSTFAGPIAIDGGTLQIAAPFVASGPVTGGPGTELALTGSAGQAFASSADATLASLRLAGGAVSFGGSVTAQSVVAASGSTTFNAPLSAGTWLHQAAAIGGAGNITVTGSMTMIGGTLGGGGAVMDVLGPMTLSTSTTKSIGRTLRTHGAAHWDGGQIIVGGPGGNAQWRIMPGGSLDIAAAMPTITWAVGLPGTLVNEGVLRTLATTGVMNIVGVGLSNAGTVELEGSLLRFSAAPAYLQTAGSTIVHAGRELEHAGSVVIAGGTLTGGGLVDADVLATGGTVAPGDGIGALSIEGAMTFGTSASLALEIASAEQDRLVVAGPLACAGGIGVSLAAGFVPSIGESFVVATCTSRTGAFAAVTAATPLPADRRWAIQHGPTSVTLVVVPALPCAGDLDLDATVGPIDLALLLGAWGTDGSSAAADLNEDGTVSAPDLAILLGAWGPCPTGNADDAPDAGPALAGGDPAASVGDVPRGRVPARREPGDRRRHGRPSERAAERVADGAAGAPEVRHGDLVVDDRSFLDRAVASWTTIEDGTCAVDDGLLIVEGTATLDGVFRITLADGLDLGELACLRILVADAVVGRPRVEWVTNEGTIELEVEVGERSIDVRLPAPAGPGRS